MAEPIFSSWRTQASGQYARIRHTIGAATAATWTGQTLPAYADVIQIDFSPTYVYVRSSGLASYVMGPWYLDAAHTQIFPNKPVNQNRIARFPRTPQPAATKTNTSLGAAGLWVNGVAVFNFLDAYSYRNSTAQDAQQGPNGGDGVWNRDAQAELPSFDPTLAHQPGNGEYHTHLNPMGLRYWLGDHVTFTPGAGSTLDSYAEATTAPTHSPILGWAYDGYPIYGPYGYAAANDPASGVRRMVSGYVKRTGQFGTTNVNSTGRTSLPLWAQIAQNRTTLATNQYGPATTRASDMGGSYALGRYTEDWDHLGDLPPASTAGQSWDLDRYNGRTCVTPEFPGGTYAYFVALNADNTPAFPYYLARQYYGVVSGGAVTSVAETVTNHYTGGKSSPLTLATPAIDGGTGNVTLTWSSVEGGPYVLSNSLSLQTWSDFAPVTATGVLTQRLETGGANVPDGQKFYRVTRTAIANSAN